MAVDFKLKGIDKVLANLNKEIKKIEGRSLKGLIRGSIIVRRAMEKEVPKTPIDTGNLRSSYFTVTNKGGTPHGRSPNFTNKGFDGKEKKVDIAKLQVDHEKAVNKHKTNAKGPTPFIIFGYSANYALFVHEDIGANFQRPGAGAKFFEVALQRNTKKILEVIAKEAKIK